MVAILHNIFPRLSIQSDTVLAVFSVCTSIYFAICCSGGLTGACFNPVLAIANIPFVAIVRGGTADRNFMDYLLSYIFGPLIGAILAGLFCKYVIMPHIPHYYDTMLQTFRDEMKNRYNDLNGSQMSQSLDNTKSLEEVPEPSFGNPNELKQDLLEKN